MGNLQDYGLVKKKVGLHTNTNGPGLMSGVALLQSMVV